MTTTRTYTGDASYGHVRFPTGERVEFVAGEPTEFTAEQAAHLDPDEWSTTRKAPAKKAPAKKAAAKKAGATTSDGDADPGATTPADEATSTQEPTP